VSGVATAAVADTVFTARLGVNGDGPRVDGATTAAIAGRAGEAAAAWLGATAAPAAVAVAADALAAVADAVFTVSRGCCRQSRLLPSQALSSPTAAMSAGSRRV